MEDYRYFTEPDLVPLVADAAVVTAVDAALPELPRDRRAALASAGAGSGEAALLVERGQDELVLAAVAAGADVELTVTRVVNDLAADDWSKVAPERLAALVAMERAGKLTATQAKQVLAEMSSGGGDPAAVAERLGFEAMAADALEAVVDEVIEAHPGEWSRFCAGEGDDRKKMAGFLTGQVMRATRGRADGAAVNRLLTDRAAGRAP